MKLNSLISVRFCLFLSAALPLFLLTAKPGLSEAVPTFKSESSVAPNLKQKLDKLSPRESIVIPNNNGASFVQESGPSWVEYIQHKSRFENIRINPSDRPGASQVLQEVQLGK
jgi:hypothetical protein